MPGPELVGVVAPLGVACGLTEVLEVASCPFGVVLVVAGDRLGAPLEPPPRRTVAFLEVRRRASGVSLITQSQDRPFGALDQFGGRLVGLGAAAGDVARCDDLRGGSWFRIAAPSDEGDRDGSHHHSRRGPPSSDQPPLTHEDKVSEGFVIGYDPDHAPEPGPPTN